MRVVLSIQNGCISLSIADFIRLLFRLIMAQLHEDDQKGWRSKLTDMHVSS